MSKKEEILFALFWAIVATLYLKYKHFFSFVKREKVKKVFFVQVLGAFGLYFFVSLFLFPGILFFFSSTRDFSFKYFIWSQTLAIVLSCSLLIVYGSILQKSSIHEIMWGGRKRTFAIFCKSFGKGVLAWFISYPYVLLITLLIRYAAHYWGKEIAVEQLTVKYLLQSMGDWKLFVPYILAIGILIPIVEELLFRGFLQTWLRFYLGRSVSIVVVGIFFASAHFTFKQGLGNLELLPALFVLSCFLSFLYEKERTLFAPIALHMAFNCATVAFLFFSH